MSIGQMKKFPKETSTVLRLACSSTGNDKVVPYRNPNDILEDVMKGIG
jgi:hypothetical protein